MVPSRDLFELIKSLDKGEKTYFKKFSRIHSATGGSKYIQLFNAISTQAEYDEPAIIKKFRGTVFANQFPVAKNYLFNSILKSLRAFHKNKQTEVHDLLQNAEIFYEKGFLKQSHKALLKAKQTARKHEMYMAMPELFRMEERISVDRNNMDALQSILREKTEVLAIQENTQTYRDINFKILGLYRRHGKAREKSQLKEMKKICDSRLMQNESLALSFEAKCRFHEAWSLYYYTRGNTAMVLKHLNKIIHFYHQDPEKIADNFRMYIAYTGNLIKNTLESRDYDQTEKHLATLHKASRFAKTQIQKAKFYDQYYSISLVYYNSSGKFSKAMAAIPAVARDFEKYARNLGELQKAVILFNVSLSYFCDRQYDQSISWFNRIRNEVNFKAPSDLERSYSIFYLIVNYEAGKAELLPYLIKSLYRLLSRKSQLYRFESIILSFLRNSTGKINTNKELVQAFQKLKTKLIPLQKDPLEKNAFAYFDYVSWLESKIENKSFAEVVKRKAEVKN